MAWPTQQDYQEALQNPESALADPELRVGHFELDKIGFPKPNSGSFATVYRVHCSNRDWAVRVFTKGVQGQKERYEAISAHLGTAHLSYMVDFVFLAQGIKVRGQWYPILKMEWVNGTPLDRYVATNFSDRSKMLSLADQWIQMMLALQHASIAHGDLQHGNVLIVNDALRLVDYDGMFVPSLHGTTANESGHRNYQHPRRTNLDFGPNLDNFSAWTVYLSLIALSSDPTLWIRFKGGDECLLLRSQDFDPQSESAILKELEKSHDTRIQSVAHLFRSLLNLESQFIPALDGQLSVSSNALVTRLPVWMEDHVELDPIRLSSGSATEASMTAHYVVDPSWMIESLAAAESLPSVVQFQGSFLPERSVLAASALGAILVLFTFSLNAWIYVVGAVLVMLVDVAVMVIRYRGDSSVSEFLVVKTRLNAINDALRATELTIKQAEKTKSDLLQKANADRMRIEREENELASKQRQELEGLENLLQSGKSSATNKRQLSKQDEAAALQRNRAESEKLVLSINEQIGALNQNETNEVASKLRSKQTQFMSDRLCRYHLVNANIPGIGVMYTSRLLSAGVITADDITYGIVYQINGIGDARARSLVNWKREIEMLINSNLPKVLAQDERAAISSKYVGQLRTLEDQRKREQQAKQDRDSAIRKRYVTEIERLDSEIETIESKIRVQKDLVEARYMPEFRTKRESLLVVEKNRVRNIQELDESTRNVRQKLFGLHWELGKEKNKIKKLEKLSFRYYLKGIIPVF